jgi:hypothetical protein
MASSSLPSSDIGAVRAVRNGFAKTLDLRHLSRLLRRKSFHFLPCNHHRSRSLGMSGSTPSLRIAVQHDLIAVRAQMALLQSP